MLCDNPFMIPILLANTHLTSFYYVIVLHITAWVYGWVVQEIYTANPPSLDWSDKGFTRGLFVVILWGEYNSLQAFGSLYLTHYATEFSRQALQNWMYYLISTMTDNISELCKLIT